MKWCGGTVERSHRVADHEFYPLLDNDGITDDIHLFNDRLREWENACEPSAEMRSAHPSHNLMPARLSEHRRII